MIAKQCMYLVLILRLHIVYNNTIFKYKERNLYFVAIVSCIYSIINATVGLLYTESEAGFYDNAPFAMHCAGIYRVWYIIVVAVGDGAMCLWFLYSFLRPIRILIKNEQKSDSNYYDLLHIAVKAFTLTSCALASTLTFLTYLLFTDSLLLLGVEVNMNCICMSLMTPYYSDAVYYDKWCCLCINLTNKCFKTGNEASSSSKSTKKPAMELESYIEETMGTTNTNKDTVETKESCVSV